MTDKPTTEKPTDATMKATRLVLLRLNGLGVLRESPHKAGLVRTEVADAIERATGLAKKEAALRATARTDCVCYHEGICYVCLARAALTQGT